MTRPAHDVTLSVLQPRWIARCVAGAVIAVAPMLGVSFAVPVATADECPDIEVVFARGTGAPPGTGWLGGAFVDLLRSKVGGRSVGVYPVNYPAGFDFSTSVVAGAADARAHVEQMSVRCPGTRLVLGGNSQGAGVIDLITMAPAPIAGFTPNPIPDGIADHIAAVVVFGNPLRDLAGGGPLDAHSPVYGSRTIDLCAAGDPFCSPGTDFPAHFAYIQNGMADQAAAFAAQRL